MGFDTTPPIRKLNSFVHPHKAHAVYTKATSPAILAIFQCGLVAAQLSAVADGLFWKLDLSYRRQEWSPLTLIGFEVKTDNAAPNLNMYHGNRTGIRYRTVS